MKITATTQGFDDAADLIASIPVEFNRRILRKAMLKAVKPVIHEAKKNAASSDYFDTGLLRDSIGASVTAKKKKSGQLIGDVVGNVRPLAKRVLVERTAKDGSKHMVASKASQYAHHLEFGNVHMSAKPIFRPAMDTAAPEAFARYVDTIADEMDILTAKAATKAAKAAKKKAGKK